MKACYFLFLVLILPFITSCGSHKTIVNGLDEKEANEILVFLSSKGIEAQKLPSSEGGGTGAQKLALWDISVTESEAREAMSLLNQAGLPRRRGQNLLNIFQNTGLVPSELQDKIRYQAGLAEQIASTIRKIDGVLDAEVQISFPEEDPLNPGATKGKITSSVYIKHSGVLDDPNSHLLTKIKRLVAASVTGLDYDNVTVIPDRARFSEVGPGTLQGAFEGEKQYVTIWSIILAKESVTRFRVVFFTFAFLILFLVLALVWFIWKCFPLLEKHGGVKELFHMRAILGPKEAEAPKKEEAPAAKEEKGSVKDKVKEGQQAIDTAQNPEESKDVDET